MGIKMNHLSHRQMSESFWRLPFIYIRRFAGCLYIHLSRQSFCQCTDRQHCTFKCLCCWQKLVSGGTLSDSAALFRTGNCRRRMGTAEISADWASALAPACCFIRNYSAFAVGFFPVRLNLFANALVSFSCAMQVQTFRKVNGYAFASTMCIGNLRSCMESLCVYARTRDKHVLHKSACYLGIILMFAVGAGVGGHCIALLVCAPSGFPAFCCWSAF